MRRLVLVIASAFTLAAGTIGVLHVPAARPLLTWIGLPCPVDDLSAEQVGAIHRAAFEALRGTAPAPARSAFGLQLASSRESDVWAWVEGRGLSCASAVRGFRYVACRDVPAAALGSAAPALVHDLTFSFGRAGTLAGIDTVRRGLSTEDAAALASHISRELEMALGEPTQLAGSFTPSYLGAGPFRTSFVAYRFSDYLVSVTAVNVPGTGLLVREQYVAM